MPKINMANHKYDSIPLNRFRNIARFVILNKDIIQQFQVTSTQEIKKTCIDFIIKDLDPTLYTNSTKEIYNRISGDVKQLTTKESSLRSEEEIIMIVNEIKNMPFFVRLEYSLLLKLAKFLYYQYVDKGTIIIKQGHNPMYLYYIIKGQVSALYYGQNLATDMNHIKEMEITEINTGSYFAELGLLYKSKRELTFISKVPCQFFIIEDEYFNKLIRDIVWNDANEKRKLLLNMPAFDEVEWNEQQLQIISTLSKIVNFSRDKVILGGSDKQPKDLYFIASGSCKFVRAVKYKIVNELGKKRYRPFEISNCSSVNTFHKALLEICIVKYGSYFGVGEDMIKTYLIAIEDVSCMLIPRSVMLKCGLKSFVEKLCQIHNKVYPTEQKVLDLYYEHKKLLNFQKNIVEKYYK